MGIEIVEVDYAASCFAECAPRPDGAFGGSSSAGCEDYETGLIVGQEVVGADYDLGGHEGVVVEVGCYFDALDGMVVLVHVTFEGCSQGFGGRGVQDQDLVRGFHKVGRFFDW